MNPLLIAALAIAGLVIGRGQRAVVFRYGIPAGEPARQCCPACGHRAQPARWPPRLIPVPAGRCPACHVHSGPPICVVEATTVILLAALAARIQPGLVLAAACWLVICDVPLAFIDAAVHRLPDVLTAPAYAGTAMLLLLAAVTGGHWHHLARAGLGGIALAGFYLVLVLISPAGLGLGDAKAAPSLGTLLAWSGWGSLLDGALAGFILAGAYGLVLLMLGRASRKQHIPFGPFMIAGALLVLLA